MKWATAMYIAYAAVATASSNRHVHLTNAAVVAMGHVGRPVGHNRDHVDHEGDQESIFQAEGWTVPYASLLGLKPADLRPTPTERAPLSLVGHRHTEGNVAADVRTTPDAVLSGASEVHAPIKGPLPGTPTQWHFWFHCITFAILIKALCIMGNIGMAIAPMSTVNKIKQAQETGTMDSLPYITIMCTGTQWCFYGVFAWAYTGNRGFLIVLYANCLGAILGTYYAFIFQKYCRSEETWRTMIWYCKIGGALFVSQCIVLFLIPMERGLLYCGCMAAFLSILVTISPLSTIRDIYRTEFGTFFQNLFSPKLALWRWQPWASFGEPQASRRITTETTHLCEGPQPEALDYGCNPAFSGNRLDVDDGCTGGTC
eukprot:GEMP01030516.1.p1 GENE.GEMP01030516.1~~GEMP01030516.1.p1  ORF type:complete len:371 (+),score=45.58 GEMP01030516.1:162-1274(+)